jgi:hypothetical protein
MPSMRKRSLRRRQNKPGVPPTGQCRGGSAHAPISGSFGEGGQEGETTLPTLSSACITHPPLGYIVCLPWSTIFG